MRLHGRNENLPHHAGERGVGGDDVAAERGVAAPPVGELPAGLDSEAAAILFIGRIQGLVMQSLLAGEVQRMRRDAPRVFAIYRNGIRCPQ